eukprot:scaffold3653_cov124-Cylindrotheca_fusiformis.AAC.5
MRANALAVPSFIGALVSLTSLLEFSISFQPFPHSCKSRHGNPLLPLHSLDGGGGSSEDWRAFRAKLVQNETIKSTNTGAAWAYDSGLLIEKGSIVLSRVEDSLGCHDLRQPYFAKCVVLIVDNDDGFTQGIILNRPSNVKLNDEDIVYVDDDGERLFQPDLEYSDEGGEGINAWRMFFGGDIAGLYDEDPLIVCLHNNTSELAQSVSDEILPGVYLTSHLAARSLVQSGLPAESFFSFYGFCGWDPGQLETEVKRGSWSMVSVDSGTLWKDLQALREPDYDPRMVGLDMWQEIATAIDFQDDESQGISLFQDLMLKEWATKVLLVPDEEDDHAELEDADIHRALKAAKDPSCIRKGALVRGSMSEVSPFLLQDQFLHKCTLLILQETDEVSLGLVLNLPSTDTYTIDLPTGVATFPIRYGGPGGEAVEDPLIWLHFKNILKAKSIGNAINKGDPNSVWTCTLDQVIDSIESGIATADDFVLVQGFCVWEKALGGAGGILGEVIDGKFEAVSSAVSSDVWAQLLFQGTLSEDTLLLNFKHAVDAWTAGDSSNHGGGIEVDCRRVFNSNVSVGELCDEALLAWVKIFLLGNAEYYR